MAARKRRSRRKYSEMAARGNKRVLPRPGRTPPGTGDSGTLGHLLMTGSYLKNHAACSLALIISHMAKIIR